jgi:fatty-acyl-CoA synthase
MAEHSAVVECCVVGVPDDHWGEVGRALVALRPHTEASAADLIAWCEGGLARYKQPRAVVFVPACRATPSAMSTAAN